MLIGHGESAHDYLRWLYGVRSADEVPSSGRATVHVGYCATVHPADDLDGVIADLDGCALRVRAELDVPVLGIV